MQTVSQLSTTGHYSKALRSCCAYNVKMDVHNVKMETDGLQSQFRKGVRYVQMSE